MESQGLSEAKSNDMAGRLYASCCSHDRQVRNAAFQQLGEFLLRIAYSRLHARAQLADLAEECTQQALVTVWQKLKEHRGPDRPEWFMSWAAGIVIHKVLDALRHRSRHPSEALEPADVDGESPAPELADTRTIAPEQHALSAEMSRELLRLIRDHPRLSPDAKVVLLGGYLHDQNDAELAAHLHKETVTIRVIRSRGLKLLREDRRFMAELAELAVPQLQPESR